VLAPLKYNVFKSQLIKQQFKFCFPFRPTYLYHCHRLVTWKILRWICTCKNNFLNKIFLHVKTWTVWWWWSSCTLCRQMLWRSARYSARHSDRYVLETVCSIKPIWRNNYVSQKIKSCVQVKRQKAALQTQNGCLKPIQQAFKFRGIFTYIYKNKPFVEFLGFILMLRVDK